RWLGYLANGFTLSPLVVVSTGAPFTPTLSGNVQLNETINGVNYSQPSGGTGSLLAGGTPPGPFFGPNSFQMRKNLKQRFRLAKEFKVWESWKLMLTGDAFNIFNHPSVTSVSTQMFSISTTGLPAGTANLNFVNTFRNPIATSNTLLAQRQIQIGLRLDF